MMRTLLLTLLIANQAGAAALPNWPQFHGPNSSGIAETDKPPIEFGPSTNLIWEIEVPAGLSSPCVWGDQIFLTAAMFFMFLYVDYRAFNQVEDEVTVLVADWVLAKLTVPGPLIFDQAMERAAPVGKPSSVTLP